MNKEKVLFVLGSTGVGKSDLAIQIAIALGSEYNIQAELINADAIQMFNGLDICTNKPTAEELNSIPHHLFGHVDSMKTDYNVSDYVNQAKDIISNLNSRSILPIVVGGSNYYIAALAFEDYLTTNKRKITSNDNIETDYTYERLQQVDKEAAEKIHPNDQRKIKRQLQIYDETQTIINNTQSKPHILRYDCKFLYLMPTERSTLFNRIDKRVHKMIERGMLKELEQFELKYKIVNSTDEQVYQKGILQSIGFKEFVPYLKNFINNSPEIEIERSISECISSLQSATRNYARKQENWFRNTWAADSSPLLYPNSVLYELKVSGEIEEWNKQVFPVGLSVALLLLGKEEKNKIDISCFCVKESRSSVSKNVPWQKYNCTICDRVCNGLQEWEVHLKSKQHKKKKKKSKKIQENSTNLLNTETDVSV